MHGLREKPNHYLLWCLVNRILKTEQESCSKNTVLINNIIYVYMFVFFMHCPDKINCPESVHSRSIQVLYHVRSLQLIAHLPVVFPCSYACRTNHGQKTTKYLVYENQRNEEWKNYPCCLTYMLLIDTEMSLFYLQAQKKLEPNQYFANIMS